MFSIPKSKFSLLCPDTSLLDQTSSPPQTSSSSTQKKRQKKKRKENVISQDLQDLRDRKRRKKMERAIPSSKREDATGFLDDVDRDQAKKKEKKSIKKEKSSKKKEQISTIQKTADVIIGLDLSLNSPGVCCFLVQKQEWHWIGFCEQQQQQSFIRQMTKSCPLRARILGKMSQVYIHLRFEENQKQKNKEKEEKSREYVNALKTSSKLTYVFDILDKIIPDKQTIVAAFIEGIAMHGTGDILGLSAVSGAYQNQLACRKWPFHFIEPNKNKMNFTGNGSADKQYMWAAFKRYTDSNTADDQNVEKAAGLQLYDLPPYSWLKNKNLDVPTPHQDLVDAFALVCNGLPDFNNETSKSKNKSKKKILQILQCLK
jgi:Holliday junction resolvasome RuvABC endonuclease subunit